MAAENGRRPAVRSNILAFSSGRPSLSDFRRDRLDLGEAKSRVLVGSGKINRNATPTAVKFEQTSR